MKPLSIYVHIPFCVKKCAYCDFLSFESAGGEFKRYTAALTREITEAANGFKNHKAETVFFGGGTPTILRTEQISSILRIIRENFNVSKDLEATIEANPGTVDADSLSRLRDCGFNRISFGFQSNNNRLLHLLGRIHDRETFDNNFNAARAAGFKNINVDLIHSLPCQSEDDWEDTLNYVINKQPEHISAYGLILEEGTPLYKSVSEGSLCLPSEETQLEMCRIAERKLEIAGYGRYEISNFAKPGFNCRHNITYWRCEEYVGFGLGASSCVGSVRFRNEADLGKYLDGCFEKYDVQQISMSDAISEFMFLGLRMTSGISEKEFYNRFGKSVSDVYGNTIISLTEAGLIERKNGGIRLTQRGTDVSNRVFAELLM